MYYHVESHEPILINSLSLFENAWNNYNSSAGSAAYLIWLVKWWQQTALQFRLAAEVSAAAADLAKIGGWCSRRTVSCGSRLQSHFQFGAQVCGLVAHKEPPRPSTLMQTPLQHQTPILCALTLLVLSSFDSFDAAKTMTVGFSPIVRQQIALAHFTRDC